MIVTNEGGSCRTAAYIDLEAIKSNVRELRGHVRPETKLMAVIKADGYGHGALQVAKAIDSIDTGEDEMVAGYGVAIVEEGISLRKEGVIKPILLLGYTGHDQLSQVVEYDLTQAIFEPETAVALNLEAVRQNKIAEIHIKLDTGMGRIGFACNDESIEKIVRISKLSNLRITGMFSHMSRADEYEKENSYLQFMRFNEMAEKLKAAGVSIPVRHISNSAASIDLPDMNLDMVRLGIVIYGMYPSDEVEKDAVKLIPALSWRSCISFVKDVKKGTPISYGGTFVAKKDMKIATVPVGYADGFPRALSNKGCVLLHGKRADIVGRVCMDQFMIDVTDISEVRQGDVVTLIGTDGSETITMEEQAALAGSFNYEFACNISNRVPRIYNGE